MVTFGRKKIYFNSEVNEETIPVIINEAMKTHLINVEEMQYLIDVYLGKQDILDRVNQYSSGINEKIVLNYSEEIVRDIIGYTYGKPTQYTQKKTDFRDDIQVLSDILDYENSYAVDIKTQTFVSITGLGYELTFPKGSYDDTPEIPLKLRVLDPRNTFYVYSGYIDTKPLLSCTYCDIIENKLTYRVFYIFTETTVYIYKTKGTGSTIQQNNLIESYNHLLDGNPITQYENNQFITGDFEKAVTILNALNTLASDGLNDIEQFVQSVLVFVNAEIDQTELDKLKTNRVLQLKSPVGVTADAKYIYSNLNVNNISEVKNYLLQALRSITGTPDRNSGSNGQSTGIAESYKGGWAELEIVAKNKETFYEEAKKQQLKVILGILKYNKLINEKLQVQYIKIDIPRNKNDNIQTKTQSYSTLIATNTLDPRDALEFVDLTTDVNEVISRGEEYQKKKTDELAKVEANKTKVADTTAVKDVVVNE